MPASFAPAYLGGLGLGTYAPPPPLHLSPAVDHADEQQGATVQGVITASTSMGNIIGNLVASPIVDRYGISAGIFWLVAAMSIAVPTVFITKEERPPEMNEGNTSFLRILKALWASVRTQRFAAVAWMWCVHRLGVNLMTDPLALYYQPLLNISTGTWANMNAVGNCGAIVGSLTMAWLFDRWDRRVTITAVTILHSASNFAALFLSSHEDMYAFMFFRLAFRQAQFVCISRLLVLYADKSAGASFFAMAMMIGNFSAQLGTAIHVPLVENYGARSCFWAGSAVCLLMLFSTPFLTGGRAPTQAGSGSAARAKKQQPALADARSWGGVEEARGSTPVPFDLRSSSSSSSAAGGARSAARSVPFDQRSSSSSSAGVGGARSAASSPSAQVRPSEASKVPVAVRNPIADFLTPQPPRGAQVANQEREEDVSRERRMRVNRAAALGVEKPAQMATPGEGPRLSV